MVSEEMEGRYSCQETGVEKNATTLEVEVPSAMRLLRNNMIINESTDVILNDETVIQCVAEGGKPYVSLRWDVDGQEKTAGITEDRSREDERIISSTLNYRPNLEDKTLTCITSGQVAVPNIKINTSINVMYKPTCFSQVTNGTGTDIFFCKCEGNPPVSNLSILVNGSFYVNQHTTALNFRYPATVSCLVVNAVGETRTDVQNVVPKLRPAYKPSITTLYLQTTSLPGAFMSGKTNSPITVYTVVGSLVAVLVIVIAFVILFSKRITVLRSIYQLPEERRRDIPLTVNSKTERQGRPLPQPSENYARKIEQSNIPEYFVPEEGIYNEPYATIDEVTEVDEDGYLKTHPRHSN